MNVYDFDKTIFYPDCSFLFIRWCLRRYPKLLVTYLPMIAFNAAQYALDNVGKDYVEEKMFAFIKGIDNIEQEVQDFWDANQERISSWYLEQKRPDDLIISASPEFLLKPIAEQLGVQMIGTQLDIKTAKIIGYSCYGRQKVRQALLHHVFPDYCIDCFYSDSISDTPLALCAEQAFLVKKKATKPTPWPKLTQKLKKKILKKLEEDMTENRPSTSM